MYKCPHWWVFRGAVIKKTAFMGAGGQLWKHIGQSAHIHSTTPLFIKFLLVIKHVATVRMQHSRVAFPFSGNIMFFLSSHMKYITKINKYMSSCVKSYSQVLNEVFMAVWVNCTVCMEEITCINRYRWKICWNFVNTETVK